MEYTAMTPDGDYHANGAQFGTLSHQLLRDLPTDITEREQILVERALRYAAETEQRLADQRQRIVTLENLSSTDALTGLLNRRGFEHHLFLMLARARRYGETGVLAIADLDGFKSINDTHGHCAGDALLRCAADTLQGAVRESDVVARLGGDEFAALLVNTSWKGGQSRLRTLQWLCDSTGIVHKGHDIPLRTSLGAEPYGPHDTVEDLLHRADMAMYYDKRRKQTDIVRSAAE
ncbi:MAG: GGDEF domain-containing protein [Alphaproteobacteria bacterium]